MLSIQHFQVDEDSRVVYHATNVSKIHIHSNTNHPTAAWVKMASVNHRENKVITPLSLAAAMSLSSNSYVLQCDGKKWGSLRSELQLFWLKWVIFPSRTPA